MKPAALSIRRARLRGVTLIEALVALMVMSFGMVALVELMGNLRRSGDIAKQRSEAMRIAQEEMATLRAFSKLEKPDPTDVTVFDYENDIVTTTARSVTLPDSNTTFSLYRNVTPLSTGTGTWGRLVQVEVSWKDRASRSTDTGLQTLVLDSLIARVDPAFAGAAGIAPAPGAIRQPQDRHPAIPPAASDLGNKTSAFRPSSLSERVWVFNNVTGYITKTCDIAPATVLTAASISAATCSDTLAFVLSGTINFSNTSPANPNAPEATAVALDMTITGGTYAAPRRNSSGVVELDGSGNPVMDTVIATAPTFQCFDDAPSTSPSTQSFVNYSCIVIPSGTVRPKWSGSLQLTGLSIGTSASQYRVCRYSADYNGNGNAYANADRDLDNYEHPAVYAQVTGSLPRQNFLVVKGSVDCPTAPAVDLSTGVFVNYSTIQLQPSPSP